MRAPVRFGSGLLLAILVGAACLRAADALQPRPERSKSTPVQIQALPKTAPAPPPRASGSRLPAKRPPAAVPARPGRIAVRPDLVVTRIVTDAQCQLVVHLRNRGAAISAASLARVRLGVDMLGKRTSMSLAKQGRALAAANGAARINTRRVLKKGATVRAEVDLGAVVAEANERNNTLSAKVTPNCSGQAPAPASASRIPATGVVRAPAVRRGLARKTAPARQMSVQEPAMQASFPARITSANCPVAVGAPLVISGSGFGHRGGRVELALPGVVHECRVSDWRDERVRCTVPAALADAAASGTVSATLWVKPARVERPTPGTVSASGSGSASHYYYSGDEGPHVACGLSAPAAATRLDCPGEPMVSVTYPGAPYDEQIGDCSMIDKRAEVESFVDMLEQQVGQCSARAELRRREVVGERDRLLAELDLLPEVSTSCGPWYSSLDSLATPANYSSFGGDTRPRWRLTNMLRTLGSAARRYCRRIDELIKPLHEACRSVNEDIVCTRGLNDTTRPEYRERLNAGSADGVTSLESASRLLRNVIRPTLADIRRHLRDEPMCPPPQGRLLTREEQEREPVPAHQGDLRILRAERPEDAVAGQHAIIEFTAYNAGPAAIAQARYKLWLRSFELGGGGLGGGASGAALDASDLATSLSAMMALNEDPRDSADARVVGEGVVTELNPRWRRIVRARVDIPADAASFFSQPIDIVLDPDEEIEEWDESNNLGRVFLRIREPEPLRPDLAVSGITLRPRTPIAPGDPFNVDIRVRSLGETAAPPSVLTVHLRTRVAESHFCPHANSEYEEWAVVTTHEVDLPSMPRGNAIVRSFDFTAPPDSDKLSVGAVVHPSGPIRELEHGNDYESICFRLEVPD